MAPIKTDGPNTPPEPPEAMVNEVATILSSTSAAMVCHSIFPSRAVCIQT